MTHSWLQKFGPLLLLAYGSLVIYYYMTDLLVFLVNPFYSPLILTAGIILIVLGLAGMAHWKHYHFKEMAPRGRWKDVVLLGLLLIPLIFAPIFQPQLLSSSSAVLRGVSSDLAASTFDPTVFSKPTDERTLMEWVRILNMDPEPDHYKGQKFNVEGKVIFEESLPQNTFQIGQFVMTCCAADARVLALPVRYDPTVFKPKKDQWIQISGQLDEGLMDGHRQVILNLQTAKTLPTPKEAYEIFK